MRRPSGTERSTGTSRLSGIHPGNIFPKERQAKKHCSQAKGRGTATHAEPLPRSFVVTTQPSTIIHEIFSPQSYTRAQRCSHFHSRTDVPMNHQINLGLVFRMYSMIFFDMKQKSYKLGSVCVSHELCHLSAFLMQIKSIYNVKGYFRCIFRAFRRSKVSMTHHSLRDQ